MEHGNYFFKDFPGIQFSTANFRYHPNICHVFPEQVTKEIEANPAQPILIGYYHFFNFVVYNR